MRKHHPLGFVVLATAIVCAQAARASADDHCKPVVGSFEAKVQPPEGCAGPLCTAGRVWGGIQGNYAFTMHNLIAAGACPLQNVPPTKTNQPAQASTSAGANECRNLRTPLRRHSGSICVSLFIDA